MHKQKLLYHNIIDTSLNTSPLEKEDLDLIAKIDDKVSILLPHIEALKINLSNCNSFKSLKNFYDDNKQKTPFLNKNDKNLVSE